MRDGLCDHCRRRPIVRPYRLCATCYADAAIRQEHDDGAHVDRSHLPATGHYSCLWCRHQCNERPMALCVQCQTEFFERRQRAERDPKWATLGD